jgi:23S rRNA pseudouridine2604 synthase
VIIHKPVGFVSAQPEPGQTPAARLVRPENAAVPGEKAPPPTVKLAPLGRLDQDSRGLLLLSEDGVLAKAVIGPESRLEKEYLVRVEGQITPRKLALLRHGLELDGRRLKPALITEIGAQRLRFVLQEGRNRQIRRMAELVDLGVTDLLRVRIGPLTLGSLAEGRWRLLALPERRALLGGG